MPLATSAASKSSMLPRACPDSARAIISSALKVRIRPSDSSMVRSSAARYSASLPELASASSARLRKPRQRRLQVVGDVVGDFLQAHHQRLDTLQHGVEIFRQTIEFVAAAPDRQPAGEIAGHDALGGAGHGVDPPQHPPRHEDAAADAEHDDDQKRPLRGVGDDAEQPPPFLQIAPDQQPKTVAEFGDAHQRAVIARCPDRQAGGRRSPTSPMVAITPGASEPTLPPSACPVGVVTR